MRKKPIHRSLILGSALFVSFLSIILSVQSYITFSKAMYTRYNDRLNGIVNYIHNQIDADDLYNCLQTKEPSEKYKKLQQLLNGMVDDFELFYLYIVQPSDTMMYNICSATNKEERDRGEEDMAILEPTDAYTTDVLKQFQEVMNKDEIVYFEEDSEWGAAYTACKPLVTSNETHYGLICADISIEVLHKTINSYVLYNVILTLVLGVLFGILLIIWLRHNVTGPILALEKSARHFAEKSRQNSDPDDLFFETPPIHTRNEVESLSNAISQMSEDMRNYVKDIVMAEEKIKSAEETVADMTMLAYKDPLTRVGSKIAYDKVTRTLEKEINEKEAEFAIAMVDLNNLKTINDNYGHANGNCYITGASQIICNVFRHSPVYRIGGDEFVVLLKNSDYKIRYELMVLAQKMFHESASDTTRDPWERFSAAIGLAEYQSGDNVDSVFNRADENMYQNKVAMKKDKPKEN